MSASGTKSRIRDVNVNNNTSFPSCFKPLFESEAKCRAIDMKVIFYSHANKTHFHKKIDERNREVRKTFISLIKM